MLTLPRTDNMFDFIKTELTEARLFKYPENLEGRDAHDVARLLFASLLALEILRHEQPLQASQYVLKTMAFGDFDHMRMATTDLGNMISVLANQSKYEDELKTRIGLYAPELQIRTYLRGTLYGPEPSRDRRFFIAVEADLMISGADMRQARRVISNWKSANTMEQKLAYGTLRREFQRNGTQLDIWRILQEFHTP